MGAIEGTTGSISSLHQPGRSHYRPPAPAPTGPSNRGRTKSPLRPAAAQAKAPAVTVHGATLRGPGGFARVTLGPHRGSREDTSPLLENKDLAIADIYVPAKRRRTLKQTTVEALAESILEDGLKVPILVREDGARYVLVEGLHRLEACRALGEEVIACTFVQARS